MTISKPSIICSAFTVHDLIGFDNMATYLLDKAAVQGTTVL